MSTLQHGRRQLIDEEGIAGGLALDQRGGQRLDRPCQAPTNQIAHLLQVRSEGGADSQPTRRQDVDFLFLAATPQQARGRKA